MRTELGVEQEPLSLMLGKARNYISRIETYERRLGIVDLIEIANVLGVQPVDLFAEITRDATSEPIKAKV